MIRSAEEEREYQNLSRNRKQRYDFEVSQDPTLTHRQVMQIIGFREAVIDVLPTGGGDVDITDNRVKKSLLEKVGEFLRETAPSVWRSVKEAFYSAITYLGDLIARGVYWVTDNIVVPIIEIIEDIFS